jgi:arginase
MKIQIIQVPYDSGHESLRTGRGPDHFMQRGVVEILRDRGHEVDSYRITSNSYWKADIETTFELDRLLAEQVGNAIANNKFPFVLAGSCNCCVGTLAGIGQDSLGVVWFDAHGDFNTPETTTSGLLDGMGLAMAAGRCWRALLKTVPGFKSIPEANIVHIGGYDFDPEEDKQLRGSGINIIKPDSDLDALRHAMDAAFTKLSKQVKKVYVHMDLDVLDTGEAMANHAATPGGLSVSFVEEAIGMIKDRFEICAGAIGSFDPDYDKDDKVLNAGIGILLTIVA